MSRWFRFHADAMRNPKVAKLTDREFRLWVRLLAVASENDGSIPSVGDLKVVLNARLDHLLAGVERLLSVGLIDRKDVGYEPHNWRKFQYKSDTSTDRVKKFRAERNVSETPPDTETDTETEKKKERGGADAPTATGFAFVGKVIRLDVAAFNRWHAAYPKVNMTAELTKADDYYSENPPPDGKWFFPVSKWLAKANADAGKRDADPDAEIYRNVL